MGLTLSRANFPGAKTLARLYNKLPGGGKIKAVIVGATVGAVAVAAIAAGAIGIAGLIGAAGATLLGSSLIAAGIITALPAVFEFLGNSIQQLYQFNWNISDKEIDAQLKQDIQNLYGMLGEAAGRAVGWLTCGIIPGVATFAFNPFVAKMVMADMSEQAKDEVWGALAACQHSAVAALGNALALQSFKSARRWAKKKGSPQYQFLAQIFGAERLDKWGQENQPSWSLASYTEKQVESIKDPNWRNFTESFVDSLLDSCTEALSSLGNSTAQAMAAHAAMLEEQRQRQMVVEVEFDRSL